MATSHKILKKKKKQKTIRLTVKLPKTRKFMQRTPRLQNPEKDCKRAPLSFKISSIDKFKTAKWSMLVKGIKTIKKQHKINNLD